MEQQLEYQLFLNFLNTNPSLSRFFHQYGDDRYRDGILTGFGIGLIFVVSVQGLKRYLGIPSLLY
jgi:hypothetical protein